MSEKQLPDSPGIWVRDGKFYRVWQKPNDGRLTAAEITEHGAQLGTFWADEYEGNWRKLTAEPPTCEAAKVEFARWLKDQPFDECLSDVIADRAAEIFAGVRQPSVAERIDTLLEHVPPPDIKAAGARLKQLRLGKQMGLRKFAESINVLPSRYCEFENGRGELNVAEVLNVLDALQPQPEVIEGRGQVWPGVLMLRETPKGDIDLVRYSDAMHPGFRYMRCPTFPPRPTFQPPPKPELVLIRPKCCTDFMQPLYAVKRDDGDWQDVTKRNTYKADEVDVIDPATGNTVGE